MDRQAPHPAAYRRDYHHPHSHAYPPPPTPQATLKKPYSDPPYAHEASFVKPPAREYERASYSGPNGHAADASYDHPHSRRASYSSRRNDDDDPHYGPGPSVSRRPSSSPMLGSIALAPANGAGDGTYITSERRHYPPLAPPQSSPPPPPRWRTNDWTDDREPPRKRLNLGTSPPRSSTTHALPASGVPPPGATYRRPPEVERKVFESEEEGEMESDRSEGAPAAAYGGRAAYPSGRERFQRNGRMSLLPRDDGPRHYKSFSQRHQPAPRSFEPPSYRPAQASSTFQTFRPPVPDSGWGRRAQMLPPSARQTRSPSPPLTKPSPTPSAASYFRPKPPDRGTDFEHPTRRCSPPPPITGDATPLSTSYSPPSNVSEDRRESYPAHEDDDDGPSYSPSLRDEDVQKPPGDGRPPPPLPPETPRDDGIAHESAPSPDSPSPVKVELDTSADLSLAPTRPVLEIEDRARKMGLLPTPPTAPAAEEASVTKSEAERMDVDEPAPDALVPPRATADLTDTSARSDGPATPIDGVLPPLLRDFAACLDEKLQLDPTACEDEVIRLAQAFHAHPRQQTERTRKPRVPMPSLGPAMGRHRLLAPFLCELFRKREDAASARGDELKEEYRQMQAEWAGHCEELDRVRERLKRKPVVAPPATPAIDPQSGLPFGSAASLEVLATPGPPTSGRSTRRTAMNSFGGLGDAVRSEAEFQEILATLEHADLRDPNMRAMRTTATVPNMALTSEERALLVLDEENSRVADPVGFYGIADSGAVWTAEEEDMFQRRYAQYPKQFGKIAAKLPDKTRADCVKYYYLTKHGFDYRSLLDRRGRDGRRKKGRRFAGRSGNEAKPTGKSLLANIKPSLADEEDDYEDEEDESVPPSPATGMVALPTPGGPATPATAAPSSAGRRGLSRPVSSETLGGKISASAAARTREPSVPSLGATTLASARKAEVTINGEFPSVLRPISGDADAYMTAMSALGQGSGVGAGRVAGAVSSAPAQDKPKPRRRGKNAAAAAAGDGGEPGAGEEGQAPKKRAATSSYWTIEERAQFLEGLKKHGKDWEAIAAGVANKTAMQCRNYFQNHSKKLGLAELVEGRHSSATPDASERQASVPAAPREGHQDFVVPIDVPLQQSIPSARLECRSSPPLPSSIQRVSEATPQPPVWRTPPAGLFHSTVSQQSGNAARFTGRESAKAAPPPRQSSMNIRNLLNDDAAEPSSALMDARTWFGGDGDDAVSTEDERETRPVELATSIDVQRVNGFARPPTAPPYPPSTASAPAWQGDRSPQAMQQQWHAHARGGTPSSAGLTPYAFPSQDDRPRPDSSRNPAGGGSLHTRPSSFSGTFGAERGSGGSADSSAFHTAPRPKLPSLNGGLLNSLPPIASSMHRSSSLVPDLLNRPSSHPSPTLPSRGSFGYAPHEVGSYPPPLSPPTTRHVISDSVPLRHQTSLERPTPNRTYSAAMSPPLSLDSRHAYHGNAGRTSLPYLPPLHVTLSPRTPIGSQAPSPSNAAHSR